MKITKGRLDKRSSPVKLRCEEKLRNRHLAEWRFRPLMRIVTVNPKIWKVNVIGIGTPPLQRIPGKTARRCVGALGVQKEPKLFYQTSRKMSIHSDVPRILQICTAAQTAPLVWGAVCICTYLDSAYSSASYSGRSSSSLVRLQVAFQAMKPPVSPSSFSARISSPISCTLYSL